LLIAAEVETSNQQKKKTSLRALYTQKSAFFPILPPSPGSGSPPIHLTDPSLHSLSRFLDIFNLACSASLKKKRPLFPPFLHECNVVQIQQKAPSSPNVHTLPRQTTHPPCNPCISGFPGSQIKSATTHEQIDPDFRFCPFTGHTVLELKSGSPLFGYNASAMKVNSKEVQGKLK